MDLIEDRLFFTSIYRINLNLDLDDILKYVNNLKQNYDYIKRTTSGGYQTNNFERLEQSEFFLLFEKVEKIVDYISQKWGISKKLRLINFWFNLDKKYDFSNSHYHREGIISGVFYIKVPSNSSRVVFERPDLQEHYFEADVDNDYNFKNYSYTPLQNQLLIFPSYIKHRVEQNLTDDQDDRRISLAFNYGL
jgi:uncharacterized protein (TIGR02466 family)